MFTKFRDQTNGAASLTKGELICQLQFVGVLLNGNKAIQRGPSLLDYLIKISGGIGADMIIPENWNNTLNYFSSPTDRQTKLKLAFNLLDYQNKGVLIMDDFVSLSLAIHSTISVTGLCRPLWDYASFGRTLFQAVGNGKDMINLDEFITSMDIHSRFIKSMGYWQVHNQPTFSSEIVENFDKNSVSLQLNSINQVHSILSLMCGIELLVTPYLNHNLTPYSTLQSSDFTAQESIALPKYTDSNGIVQTSTVSTYAPKIFDHLRKSSGIHTEDFIQSIGITSSLGNLFLGNLSLYTKQQSAGKSGSSFYTTWDCRYLIKSIPEREAQSLHRILPQLTSYFEKTPNTFLNRIYGLYQYNNEHFVILENILDLQIPIHRIYDLKGSTQGRSNDTGSGILKDLDVREPFHLGKNREAILEQICADSEFLQSIGIIDYSLMVAVHSLSETSPENYGRIHIPNNVPCSKHLPKYKLDSGGIISVDNSEIYIFSIIDYLTTYNLRKRGETFAKRLFLPQSLHDDISCVPPEDYGHRFCEYMTSVCD